MEKTGRTIGVDLGGTGISFIDMYAPDDVIQRARIDTPRTRDEIMAVLKETVRGFVEKPELSAPAGIGVAVAGQVGLSGASVVFSPNLPFKTEYPLGDELAREFGIPVFVENDANAAAIGERVFGMAKGMDDFIVITLGTGIGSGIFANGKPVRGHTGSGGEAGHMVIAPEGPLCGCGNRGCLEALASGTAIARAFKEKTGIEKSAKDICGLAAYGDQAAGAVLRGAGEYLGNGLVNLVNLFGPQAIFFTGSLSNAPDAYFAPAFRRVREHSFGTAGKDVVLAVSPLAAEVGVIGAAALPLM
ncbi:MAG: ROK family protein [Nitrospinae bacterium]|nr:ROK family protein [Nitrospinota bacterium]